jgi:hypothetical protein
MEAKLPGVESVEVVSRFKRKRARTIWVVSLQEEEKRGPVSYIGLVEMDSSQRS